MCRARKALHVCSPSPALGHPAQGQLRAAAVHRREEQKTALQVAGLLPARDGPPVPAAPPEQKHQLLARSPGEAHPPRVWGCQTTEAPETTCVTKRTLSIQRGEGGSEGGGSFAWRGPHGCTDLRGRGPWGRQVQRQHWAWRQAALPGEMRWRTRRRRWTSPEWPARARARCWGSSAAERRPVARGAVKSPHLLRQMTCLWSK